MKAWLSSFRIRLTLLFGSLSLLFGLGITFYVEGIASERMTAARGEWLQNIGKSVANTLAGTLVERDREIRLLSQSDMLVGADLGRADIRLHLERLKRSYSNYAWIGIADAAGTVHAAADGLLEGGSVAQRPWFIHGKEGAYIGDVHEAVLLAKKLPPNADPREPLRFVDFAAPILDRKGRMRGVVAAHANWHWVHEVLEAALPARDEGVEVFIISKDGAVLYPFESMDGLKLPAGLPDNGSFAVVDWGRDERFLTSHEFVKPTTSTNLSWKIIIRQPVAKALAPVNELRRNMLLSGALFTLLVMFLSYRAAVRFSRPIEQLARAAYKVKDGSRTSDFKISSHAMEVNVLAEALGAMTSTLMARKEELRHINATLEQKVKERTHELELANVKLDQLARRDALTGLHNRLSANERLRNEFLRMQRTQERYAVIMLDIDYFKRVNDTHGHDTGDEVLKHVAGIIGASLRETDFVARFGGEEFLVLLPDTGEVAQAIAEKIRAAVADSAAPVVGRVTISLGVAVALSDDADEYAAVGRADKALYKAKAEGRNRAVCLTE